MEIIASIPMRASNSSTFNGTDLPELQTFKHC